MSKMRNKSFLGLHLCLKYQSNPFLGYYANPRDGELPAVFDPAGERAGQQLPHCPPRQHHQTQLYT